LHRKTAHIYATLFEVCVDYLEQMHKRKYIQYALQILITIAVKSRNSHFIM